MYNNLILSYKDQHYKSEYNFVVYNVQLRPLNLNYIVFYKPSNNTLYLQV